MCLELEQLLLISCLEQWNHCESRAISTGHSTGVFSDPEEFHQSFHQGFFGFLNRVMKPQDYDKKVSTVPLQYTYISTS
jgi:hypothetical protein